MRVRVEYEGGGVELDAESDRLVASWDGPPDPPAVDLRARVQSAFDAPLDYPPLRRVVVPGDRVVVPFDRGLDGGNVVLSVMAEILGEVGVESITAVVDGRAEVGPSPALAGVDVVVHDPTDRESLAYLASTEAGRRIYLNRLLADADCVLPIGRLAYGGGGHLLGPWSVIEPGLGDSSAREEPLLGGVARPDVALGESSEVSWLLGSQFQVAAVPGRVGILHVVAGESRSVQTRGAALLAESWAFEADDRADLVVVGVGGPDRSVDASGFRHALRNALRLVRRGGKAVLLSGVGLDTLNAALKGPGRPAGEWEQALAWADLYLLSAAGGDPVEDLGIIPLDNAAQVAKLLRSSASSITVSQADRALVSVRD